MRLAVRLVIFGSILLCSDVAQTPVLLNPSDIAVKAAAYQKALSSWRKGDPSLEKDLLNVPVEQILKRIANDEARASALATAEMGYYGAMVNEIQKQIASIKTSFSGESPSKKYRSELDATAREQLGALIEQDRSLEKLLNEQGPEDDSQKLQVKAQIHEQRKAIADLRDNLEQQISAIEKANSAKETFDSAASQMLNNYNQLLHNYVAQSDSAKKQALTWTEYYKSLRGVVQKRASTEKTKSGGLPPGTSKPIDKKTAE